MRPTRPASLAAALLAFGLAACGGGSSAAPACTDPTTCPAPPNACQVAACVSGACGFTNKTTGTKISNPTVGDCLSTQCDGAGGVMVGPDDTDLPSASGQCTTGACVAGVPAQSNLPAGTACNSSGGAFCDGTGSCVQCVAGSDCPSGICTAGACQAPSCSDGVKNGTETAVDCGGGSCPACPDGKGCGVPSDCQSGVCTAGTCRAPTCTDAVKNGAEADVDCGGGTCPACADGKACTANGDCQSGACLANVCAKAQGAACASNGECGTGFCVDAVCCNTACNGICMQCNAAGSVGTCSNAVAGSDPDNECNDAGAASCGNTGYCSGAGSCAQYSAGTVCAAASCTGESVTQASTCSGAGVCLSGTTVTCSPYVCSPSGTSCRTSCTVNADCAAGFACSVAGICQ